MVAKRHNFSLNARTGIQKHEDGGGGFSGHQEKLHPPLIRRFDKNVVGTVTKDVERIRVRANSNETSPLADMQREVERV
jgi:hypothetical protein